MKPLFFLGLPIAFAACTSAPEPVLQDTLAPAANPSLQVRNAPVPALFAGYTARPVKGPEDWRKLNDSQSPASQEGS